MGLLRPWELGARAWPVNYPSDREGAERVAQAITDNVGDAIAVGADVSKAADVARYSKKWILRTSTTTSTFSGPFSPCRRRSSWRRGRDRN